MNLDQVIQELRVRNEPGSQPRRLPSQAEVLVVEAELGVHFHPDYVRLLREVSDVEVGPIEPATITELDSHRHLPRVVASARHYGVPNHLLPFCEDNADFYCLTSVGEVMFWSHNGWTPRNWPSLASWIEDVWLADYD